MYNNECVNGTKNEGRRKNEADEAYNLPGDSSIYMGRMQRSDLLVHHRNFVIISPPSLLSSPSPSPPPSPSPSPHSINQPTLFPRSHPSIHPSPRAHKSKHHHPNQIQTPPPPGARNTSSYIQYSILHTSFSSIVGVPSLPKRLAVITSKRKSRPCCRRCVLSAKKSYNQRINLPTNLVLLIRSPVFRVAPRG